MLSRLCSVARHQSRLVSMVRFSSQSSEALSTKKNELTKFSVVDDVGVVSINCPGRENVLSKALLSEMSGIMDRIETDDNIKSVVIMSAKNKSFIAGADINELLQAKSASEVEQLSAEGQKKLFRIERSRKPHVAAIMGTCMGGGLEVALACHYRIAVNTPNTQLALPEVKLGLLPGAGGTQRLPHLVSIQNAIDMMMTGKTLRVPKAKKIGLVDQVVQPIGLGVMSVEENNMEYLKKIAIQTAKDLSSGKLKPNRERPLFERVLNYLLFISPLRHLTMKLVNYQMMKMTAGNYPAPAKILEIIYKGADNYFNKDKNLYALEAKTFGELSQTSQSKALIGLFQGSTECKKNKYPNARKTKKMAVVGAGLMGAGIANVSIDKNIRTILIDVNDEGLARGQNQICQHLNKGVKKRKISSIDRDIALANLKSMKTYDDLGDCDVVVEAVFEEIKLKHKIIQQVEAEVRSDCVIATNTSALPIAEIASVAKHPERIIGMHYFSPVEKMQLLEIITTEKTNKETIAAAIQLGLDQKKFVVVVKDCPGFFVVRCLAPMMSEVMRLLQEGVQPSEIDRMTKDFGFPVGAATLADEVGLDVAEHVARFLGRELGPRVGGGSVDMLSEIVNSGYLGRKSGSGYFNYKGFKLPLMPRMANTSVMKIVNKYRQDSPQGVSSVRDRQLRVLTRFVNEAATCLQEGIIASPTEGDIASVFGIGFPPFWGGPFRFVDLFGAKKLVETMERFGNAYSYEQFKPADILVDHAKNDKKFHSK